MLNWMAWTPVTAVFFSVIAALLISMTIWQTVRPTTLRKGWLPIATTRGDRLFIGLLSSAFIHLAFIGLTALSLWWALGVSVLWTAILLRWG